MFFVAFRQTISFKTDSTKDAGPVVVTKEILIGIL